MTVLLHMRYLADAAHTAAQWATLAGPIAAALPAGLPPGRSHRRGRGLTPPPAPRTTRSPR